MSGLLLAGAGPGLLMLLLEAMTRRRCRSFLERCAGRLGTRPPHEARRGLLPPLALMMLGALPYFAAVALCGRPAAALLITAMLSGGFYVVDYLKFSVLREPLVWSDLYLVREIVMCPRLYFAYIGRGWWIVMALAAGLGVLAVVLTSSAGTVVPPLQRWQCAALAAAAAAAGAAALRAGSARHPLSGDALHDGAALGALYAFCLQWLLKRRDDACLRSAGLEAWLAGRERADAAAQAGEGGRRRELRFTCPEARVGHMVLVQAESLCDLRRFGLGTGPAPAMFGDPRLQHLGLLAITYLGAYTMRTEFAVLTGIAPRALGAYAYNPYLLLRNRACDSVARRARSAGYTTVCVHPNHGAFFSRRQVMASLGFEHFVDLAQLPQLARDGRHVSDEALLGWVQDYLQLHAAQRLFVFVITMQAHGPWRRSDYRNLLDEAADRPAAAAQLSGGERDALTIYAHHLRSLDRGLMRLLQALRPCDALLMYGDHLPAIAALARPGGVTPPADLLPDVLAWHVRDAAGGGDGQDESGALCYNQHLDLNAVFRLICSLH